MRLLHHMIALGAFVMGPVAHNACAAAQTPQDTSAQTASKVVDGPGPHNIDLETASGEYEERFLQVSAPAFTVKGFMQFVDTKTNRKWAPMAAVEVTGPKGAFFAGLIAFVQSKLPGKIEFAVRDERLRGLPGAEASFGRIPRSDQPIPFELRVDRAGMLQASIFGKPSRAVSIRPFEITRVRLMASTGHIRFLNIEVLPPDR